MWKLTLGYRICQHSYANLQKLTQAPLLESL